VHINCWIWIFCRVFFITFSGVGAYELSFLERMSLTTVHYELMCCFVCINSFNFSLIPFLFPFLFTSTGFLCLCTIWMSFTFSISHWQTPDTYSCSIYSSCRHQESFSAGYAVTLTSDQQQSGLQGKKNALLSRKKIAFSGTTDFNWCGVIKATTLHFIHP